jgi:hypothetical protein
MVIIASRKRPLRGYLPHLHDDCMPSRYIAETRAFFGCRASTWDTKFGDRGAVRGHPARRRGH